MANLNRIKILAEKKGISIRQLADSAGVSENQIHLMCRTNSTKISTLEKIANVLDVPVIFFFDSEASKSYNAIGNDNIVGDSNTTIKESESLSDEIARLRKENSELQEKLLSAQEKIIKLLETSR